MKIVSLLGLYAQTARPLHCQPATLYLYLYLTTTRPHVLLTPIVGVKLSTPAVEVRRPIGRVHVHCSKIWQWNATYSTKHGNSAAMHMHKVLPFSVKNELGLENYLGYQCAKFRVNRWKIAPTIVDEREKFRYSGSRSARMRSCALIKSILAINATVRAPFIWEPTFEFWWRSVKNWGC